MFRLDESQLSMEEYRGLLTLNSEMAEVDRIISNLLRAEAERERELRNQQNEQKSRNHF